MMITRKPKPAAAASGGVDIEALIGKGGSVAAHQEQVPLKGKEIPVVVRIPSDLLGRIDALVGKRQLKTPRHTWLLEALLEKVNREGK
jgi:hypothetical protein